MAAQGYIGRAPGDSSVIVARQTFTPTGITTNFTFASGYTVGYVDAYLNGARLIEGEDYTATDGSVVGLTTHAINGDVLELVVYKAFNIGDVTGALNDFSVSNDLTVGGAATVTGSITATGGVVGNVTGDATGLSGTPDLTIRNLTGVAATFTGVLSYDDVTNVDAVGYSTFREGINVQGAGSTTTTLNVSGVTTMTGDANFGSVLNIDDSIVHSGDSNTKIRFPAADTFTVETSGGEALRVDSTNRLVVGADASVQVAGSHAFVQHHGNKTTTNLSVAGYANNLGGPILALGASRSTTVGTPGTIVASGDILGDIRFAGDDGTDINSIAAAIRGEVDGTPGSNDMPGRLVFATTADGAAAATERARITSGGSVGIGTVDPQHILHLHKEDSGTNYLQITNTTTGATSTDGALFGLNAVEDVIVWQRESNDIQFGTNNAERVRITSAGNVGINSTNPQQLLDIASTAPNIRLTDTIDGHSEIDGNAAELKFNADKGNTKADSKITFFVDNSERLRIDSSGRVLVGTTSQTTGMKLQVEGLTSADGLSVRRNQSGTAAASIILAKSRGTSVGDFTKANGSDTLGTLSFRGADGAADVEGASVSALADGPTGSNDMPGALLFSTTADGAASATERARIDSSGRLLISATSSTSNIAGYGNGGIQLNSTTTAQACVNIIHRNNSANTHAIVLAKARDGGANGGRVQDDDDFGAISFQGFDGTGGSTYRQGAEIRGAVDGTPGNTDMPGRLEFLTTPDGSATPTERLRIDSVGTFHFKNGAMVENGEVTATAATGTQNIDLVNGMVLYRTSNSTGTWKPNFRINGSVSLNSVMSNGDVVSPTLVVAKGATSHYADTVQVDGSDITPEWLGGAPTEGGGSGTFDIYSYTIIKTADATFKVFGSVSTYE